MHLVGFTTEIYRVIKKTQLKSKRRINIRRTVGCGIPSSLLALRVDLLWLRSELS
jgi:hypothetical protein